MKENRRRKDLWTQETESGEEEITRNTSGNLGRRVFSFSRDMVNGELVTPHAHCELIRLYN